MHYSELFFKQKTTKTQCSTATKKTVICSVTVCFPSMSCLVLHSSSVSTVITMCTEQMVHYVLRERLSNDTVNIGLTAVCKVQENIRCDTEISVWTMWITTWAIVGVFCFCPVNRLVKSTARQSLADLFCHMLLVTSVGSTCFGRADPSFNSLSFQPANVGINHSVYGLSIKRLHADPLTKHIERLGRSPSRNIHLFNHTKPYGRHRSCVD